MLKQIEEYLNNVKMDKSPQTVAQYTISISKLSDFFELESFETLKNMTLSDCRKYQTFLSQSGIKKSSVNAYIRPLKAMFTWFVDNEYLDNSPFDKIKSLKTPKSMPVFLTHEEISAMFGACKTLTDKLIFGLLVTTGLRRSELTNLKIDDIDGQHILPMGKGDKSRRLILQPEIDDLLCEYLEYRKENNINSEYLLISKTGNKFSGESIRQKIQSIGKRAGIPEQRLSTIHPHSLRHSYAANMLESGADIKVLQVGLGHASMNTTSEIYAHVRDTVLDNAMLNMRSIV